MNDPPVRVPIDESLQPLEPADEHRILEVSEVDRRLRIDVLDVENEGRAKTPLEHPRDETQCQWWGIDQRDVMRAYRSRRPIQEEWNQEKMEASAKDVALRIRARTHAHNVHAVHAFPSGDGHILCLRSQTAPGMLGDHADCVTSPHQ